MDPYLAEVSFENNSINNCQLTSNPLCNETDIFGTITENGSYELPKSFVIIILCLYGIGSLLGVVGNAAVLFTIVIGKRLQTVTNFFLASLSASDILMTFACVPFTVLSNILFDYWIFGQLMCPLVQYCQLVLVLQRAWTMIAVACDRHFVISMPLRKRLTKCKAKVVIGLLWILAMLTALPIAINSRVIYPPEIPDAKGLCIEVWKHHLSKYIYSVFLMLLQYFIPLIIMTITYVRIGMIIWRKKIPGEPEANRDKRVSSSKRKSLKMLVALVITYAVAWLPLHILTIIGDINSSLYNSMSVHIMWVLFHFIAVSNGCINPIVYFYMKKSFRLGFTGFLRKVKPFRYTKHVRSSQSEHMMLTFKTNSLSNHQEKRPSNSK